MSGYITAIFVAPMRHAELMAVEAVQLKAGKGIVGDRFFGFRPKHTGLNLTLIEAEVIEEFNKNHEQTMDFKVSRRNFVTRGIQLNTLVGKTFRVGETLCKGIELCEPCSLLAKQLPKASLSQTEIIRALTHKGGLRAEVLFDGIVRIGNCCVEVKTE